MKCYDFEYDGICLSDLGYMICTFNSGGVDTVENGSQISFNKISTSYGKKFELSNSEYEDCLEATFQICRNVCDNNTSMELTVEDIRDLMAWLNRKSYHRFKLLQDGYYNIYYESSFNISKIEDNGIVVGLELNMVTNRPFGLEDEEEIYIRNRENNGTKTVYDNNDDEGFSYPFMKIEILQDGDLSIYNDIEDRTMTIKNCSIGEKITIDYPVITSSLESHKIQNDFNWVFFRLSNTFKSNQNNLTISIPCNISLIYSPSAKINI